jgi:hypothetical protein
VTGALYLAGTNTLVKDAVVFHDDGAGADALANDGRYTADLSGLPAGSYELVAQVSGDGKAVFTTANATRKGTNAPDQPIAPFQRAAYLVINKQK